MSIEGGHMTHLSEGTPSRLLSKKISITRNLNIRTVERVGSKIRYNIIWHTFNLTTLFLTVVFVWGPQFEKLKVLYSQFSVNFCLRAQQEFSLHCRFEVSTRCRAKRLNIIQEAAEELHLFPHFHVAFTRSFSPFLFGTLRILMISKNGESHRQTVSWETTKRLKFYEPGYFEVKKYMSVSKTFYSCFTHCLHYIMWSDTF